MPPLKPYDGWNIRHSDTIDPINPYKKYFVVCEGAIAEVYYFKKLNENRRDLGIMSNVEIVPLKKTKEDKDASDPVSLIKLAKKFKNDERFDKEYDKIIIVFDYDIYQNKRLNGYKQLLESVDDKDIIGVSNPCFEFYLLLHLDDIDIDELKKDKDNLLKNKDDYTKNILSKKYHKNAKTNKGIGNLALKIDNGIRNEKLFNQDINNIHNTLTSNIGQIIETIINNE